MQNVLKMVEDLATLNNLRTTRAMSIDSGIVNTPKCQIIIGESKVFCLFEQTFA